MFQLILENCTCYLSKKRIYVDVTAKSIQLNVSFSLWLVVKTVRKLVAPVNYEKVGLETGKKVAHKFSLTLTRQTLRTDPNAARNKSMAITRSLKITFFNTPILIGWSAGNIYWNPFLYLIPYRYKCLHPDWFFVNIFDGKSV